VIFGARARDRQRRRSAIPISGPRWSISFGRRCSVYDAACVGPVCAGVCNINELRCRNMDKRCECGGYQGGGGVEQTRQVYPRGRLAACSRSFLPLSSLRCSLRRFYRKPPCLVSLFSRAAIRVACFLSAWRENPGWGASHPRARRFPRDSCAIVRVSSTIRDSRGVSRYIAADSAHPTA